MTCKCELTGVSAQYGNNVSHSNRKTRRRYCINIKKIRFYSDVTGQYYRLRVVPNALRNIAKYGGFDLFMLGWDSKLMSQRAAKIRSTIKSKKLEKSTEVA